MNDAYDSILLYLIVNEEWLEGMCNGKVGIFPKAYIEEYNQNLDNISEE